jgi:hypothetical protein
MTTIFNNTTTLYHSPQQLRCPDMMLSVVKASGGVSAGGIASKCIYIFVLVVLHRHGAVALLQPLFVVDIKSTNRSDNDDDSIMALDDNDNSWFVLIICLALVVTKVESPPQTTCCSKLQAV